MIHIIAQNLGVEHDRTAVRRVVTMAANKLLSEYNVRAGKCRTILMRRKRYDVA